MQYGGGHDQYGRGCAVRISHIISTDEGEQCRPLPKLLRGLSVVVFTWENDILWKMIFYGKSCHNLDFISLWLYPDVAKNALACQCDYILIP